MPIAANSRIVAIRSQIMTGFDVNQLSRDTDSVAGTPNASLEHVPNPRATLPTSTAEMTTGEWPQMGQIQRCTTPSRNGGCRTESGPFGPMIEEGTVEAGTQRYRGARPQLLNRVLRAPTDAR